jgi:Arc/MetJ family transcription regulator
MRLTIDLEDEVLDELMRITGESKKSPAVGKAVVEFIRRKKAREFGRLIREGAFADAFDPDYDPEQFSKS